MKEHQKYGTKYNIYSMVSVGNMYAILDKYKAVWGKYEHNRMHDNAQVGYVSIKRGNQ